ncbi:MAG TPA: DUF3472 domain-containing protein [Terriglobales bacterium]|nr:DUF3472 domain-containing protein [Terriglobales bacterium]
MINTSKRTLHPQEAATILSMALLALCLGRAAAAEQKEFRAARSVHLNYPGPSASLFYNEVVVEKSVPGSYFMACGWDTGYFGIQELSGPDDKVVLFSVWDPTKGNDPSAVKLEDRVEVPFEGEGVRIKRFGGEGTGGQCMWKHQWSIGETNRFLLGAKIEGEKTAYTAWFWTGADWKKLATFRTRTGGRPLKGFYSFIEDFRRDVKSVHELRRARFGGGWIQDLNGTGAPLRQARFTASGAEWESKENIDAGLDSNWFYLATGADIHMSHPLRTLLESPASGLPDRVPGVPLPAEVASSASSGKAN